MFNLEDGEPCLPGHCIKSSINDYIAGPGTYVLNETYIMSRLAGVVKYRQVENKKMITVESPKPSGVIPKNGDIATARITVVNSRQAQCTILCIGRSILSRSFRGVIKKEDMKSKDKDRVDPYKCFRPGDIILAKVLPVTELHWYHLTTAENELGVVHATAEGSPAGVDMVPISWSEMQCPKTFAKEPRKVARILPENLDQLLSPLNDLAIKENKS